MNMKNRVKHMALTVALLLCSVGVALGQTKVKGVVTDENKAPLAGVTVLVKGTQTGITTSAKGEYQITIPAGSKERELQFSFVGYETQTVKVAPSATQVDVVMKETDTRIDDVVVVGYGTMRKSDLTGAVTTVKVDEDYAKQVSSVDQLLRGRAAGVQVTAATAAPGAEVNIQIRGYSSFTGGGEPLYVVDGVIMNSVTDNDQTFSSAGGTHNTGSQEGTNGLMGIAPQDIASIEILKDASATAIYGAMGANGVVLITTKMGSREKPTVSWSSTLEVSTARKTMPLLDFDEYIDYLEAKGSSLGGIFVDGDRSKGLVESIVPMDWQDYALRTALTHRHRLSISGKSKSTNYLVSANYDKTQGLLRKTGSELATLRINLDKQLTRHVKVGTRTNLSRSVLEMTQSKDYSNNTSMSSVMRSILNKRPYYDSEKTGQVEEGESDGDEVTLSDPRMWFKDYADNTLEYRITPNLFLEAKILPWLTYKIDLGADYRDRERGRWKGPLIIGTSGEEAVGSRLNTRSLRYNVDNLLMFRKTWGDHRLSGTVGMSFIRSNSRSKMEEGWNMSQYVPQEWGLNGATNTRFKYRESTTALLSYLGRAVYSYKDRYVLTATFRADGSSKFKKGNRFQYFPSFAFAWRAQEEQWFNVKWVSNLKIRGGWGRVGNEASLRPYQTQFIYGNIVGNNAVIYPDHSPGNDKEAVVGIAPTHMTNTALRWETTEQFNAGIDLGLFKNRLNITMDLYHKRTWDLLQNVSLPQNTGFTSMWDNSGEIQNRGLELSVDAVIVKTKKFTWDFGGNITFNRNKITDIGANCVQKYYPGAMYDSDGNEMPYKWAFLGQKVGGSSYFNAPANIFIEGQPMGLFYGIRTNGMVGLGSTGPGVSNGQVIGPGGINYVLQYRNYQNRPGFDPAVDNYPADGDRNFVDELYDRVVIGNPHPKFTYGFSTSFSYKNLSLSATFNGVYGNDIVNANALIDNDITRTGNVRREAFYDRWTPENPNGRFPAFDAYSTNEKKLFTDRIVEDGSYLRFANLTLSYTVPLKKKSFIQGLSVYGSVNNVCVWTKYSGWDPEVSSYGSDMFRMGVDSGSYPSARTYSLGVNLTF